MTATILKFPSKPLTLKYDELIREAEAVFYRSYILAIEVVDLQLKMLESLSNSSPNSIPDRR